MGVNPNALTGARAGVEGAHNVDPNDPFFLAAR